MSLLSPQSIPLTYDYQVVLPGLSVEEIVSIDQISRTIAHQMLSTTKERRVLVPSINSDWSYIIPDYHNLSHAQFVTQTALDLFDEFYKSSDSSHSPQLVKHRRDLVLALFGHDYTHYGQPFKPDQHGGYPNINHRYTLIRDLVHRGMRLSSTDFIDLESNQSYSQKLGDLKITAEESSAIWLINQTREENEHLIRSNESLIFTEESFKVIFEIIFSTIVEFDTEKNTVIPWALNQIIKSEIESENPDLLKIARCLASSRSDIDTWNKNPTHFVNDSIRLFFERLTRNRNRKEELETFHNMEEKNQRKFTNEFRDQLILFLENQRKYVTGRKEYLEDEKKLLAKYGFPMFFGNLGEREAETHQIQTGYLKFFSENKTFYDILNDMFQKNLITTTNV